MTKEDIITKGDENMDKMANGHNMLWIDGDNVGLDISYELGDYVMASNSDKGDIFLLEVEKEIQKRFYSNK